MSGAWVKGILAQAGLGSSFWVCLTALWVGLVFGGGSRQGLPSEFVCQVIGVALVAVALAQISSREGARFWPEMGMASLIVAVPLLQLVPLPPAVWSALPGRASLVREFMLAQGSLPWEPISLSSEATYQSIFSLACPFAVFFSTLLLSYEERRVVSLSLIAFGGLSVALALLQLVGGPDSPLRFYTITNVDLPVGFFANRNHFAALLYSLLPISAAWMVASGIQLEKSRSKGSLDHKRIFVYASVALAFAAFLLVQGLVHSRAGLVLSLVGAAMSFCLLLPFRTTTSGAKLLKNMSVVLVLAVVVMAFYGGYALLQQVDQDPVEDARFTIIKGALKAAGGFFPIGSGFGTFERVYRAFEIPGAVTSEYINRAHDDIVETLIEGGVFSLIVLCIFILWLGRNLWRVWSKGTSEPIDSSLARAGAFVPILLMLHSFLDYPMRTQALMSVAAFSCALTVRPLGSGSGVRRRRESRESTTYVPAVDTSAT